MFVKHRYLGRSEIERLERDGDCLLTHMVLCHGELHNLVMAIDGSVGASVQRSHFVSKIVCSKPSFQIGIHVGRRTFQFRVNTIFLLVSLDGSDLIRCEIILCFFQIPIFLEIAIFVTCDGP